MSVSKNNPTKIFKQIYFDENNGKLFILDSDNHHYECNIYGEKKQKFLPNVTGFSSFRERVDDKGQNLEVKLDYDKSLYRPQHKRFDGYFQFPRPLSQPFVSENFKSEEKEKLFNMLNNTRRLKIPEKNKHLLELKSNQGLHYFTSSLTMTDETSKRKFIKCIEKYIEDFREENKYKLDIMQKDRKIKALGKLKKIMLNNLGDSVIFGRQLPPPDKSIVDRFIINSRLMKRQLPKINSQNTSDIDSFNNTFFNATINTFRTNNCMMTNRTQSNFNMTGMTFISNKNKNDLSWISNLSAEEENLEKVKKRSTIERDCAIQKQLLVGYKPKIEKEKGIITKSVPKFLKSAGQLYNENMNLLRKTNPAVFIKEERRNKLYDEVLKKKRQNKLVTQKNIGF